jgi:TfoX/Sxy family transcriptional regulator of competence genes
MAYSKSLADRVRQAFDRRNVAEKRMFGGVGFLVCGNMCVGVWKASLIVRLGKDESQRALNEPHVRPFDITGRPMKGWVLVEADGVDEDGELRQWIERAVEFVSTLPTK